MEKMEGGGEVAFGPQQEAYTNRAFPRTTVAQPQTNGSRAAYAASVTRGKSSKNKPPTGTWTLLDNSTNTVPGDVTYTGKASHVSGRVTALALDPNGLTVYVGSSGGGVWKTSDITVAKPVWTSVSDDLPTGAIGSLTLAGKTLYAGTGEANGSSDSEAGAGLFASTDRGATWKEVTGFHRDSVDRSISSIAVDPATRRISSWARPSAATAPPGSTAGATPRRVPRRSASTRAPTPAPRGRRSSTRHKTRSSAARPPEATSSGAVSPRWSTTRRTPPRPTPPSATTACTGARRGSRPSPASTPSTTRAASRCRAAAGSSSTPRPRAATPASTSVTQRASTTTQPASCGRTTRRRTRWHGHRSRAPPRARAATTATTSARASAATTWRSPCRRDRRTPWSCRAP